MTIKILFVDDEKNILDGINRMFRFNKIDWNVFTSDDPEAALKIMSNESMDIVVSDILMPVMDGVTFLREIQNQFPATIRIIMSGYSNEEKAFLSTQVAHQFFNKPFDSLEIVNRLKTTLKYRAVFKDKNLLELIGRINALPSLPDIYLRLNTEFSKEEISAKKVEDIIATDISLTSKLLQLVNSSFFGLPGKIIRLQDAIQILGFNTIKSLVLYQHMHNIQPGKASSVFYKTLMDRSIKLANTARNFCLQNHEYNPYADEAFLCGLLQESGKLVLYSQPDIDNTIREASEGEDIILETLKFGVNHAQVGAYIFSLWGLPCEIVDYISYHHDDQIDDYSSGKLKQIIQNAKLLINNSRD